MGVVSHLRSLKTLNINPKRLQADKWSRCVWDIACEFCSMDTISSLGIEWNALICQSEQIKKKVLYFASE